MKIRPGKYLLLLSVFSGFLQHVKSQLHGCNDTSYNFTISGNNYFVISDQLQASDNSTVYCGTIENEVIAKALILKVDNRGNPLWGRSFVNEKINYVSFMNVTELKDGSLIITGRSQQNNDGRDTIEEFIIMAKFSAAGQLIWYRFYGLPPSPPRLDIFIYPQKILEDGDGSIYFTFHNASFNFSPIVKVDVNGNILWSRSFTYGRDGFSSSDNNAIVFKPSLVNNDTLALTGLDYGQVYIVKLNRYSGELFSVSGYYHGMGNNPFNKAVPVEQFPLSNGHIMSVNQLGIAGRYSFLQRLEFVIVEYDRNMNIHSQFILKDHEEIAHTIRYKSNVLVTPDGTIIYVSPFSGKSPNLVERDRIKLSIFAPTHKNIYQKILVANRSDYSFNRSYLGNSLVGINKSGELKLDLIFGNTQTKEYGMDCYYFQPLSNLREKCLTEKDTVFTSMEPFQLVKQDFSFDNIRKDILEQVTFAAHVENESFVKKDACVKISTCDKLQIKGEKDICMPQMPAVFVASKPANCLRTISWNIDDSAMDSLKKINDSTIHVYFKREWKGKIYASLEGCQLKDSIAIHVNKNFTAKLLMTDTSICAGDSLQLAASPGYAGYFWNKDNAANNTLMVKNADTYAVLAQRPDGCFDTDTVIVSFYPYEKYSLAQHSILCEGQNDTLSPGQNYVSYLWQDGTVDKRNVAKQPGTYWVSTIDKNGCKFSDTVNITGIKPPPFNFIVSDTSICQPGSLILKPYRNFKSYLWNTGDFSPLLIVNSPGHFSLQVKDENDCIGKQDILIVSKTCKNNIWFPSAFTPNNDGNNDFFKPYVMGELVKYQLQVFNRWGQTVFITTDPSSGWTGQFRSDAQPAGVFIWQAEYQFANETSKVAKGTVVLIR